jgi:hypothetical protein
VGGEIAGIQRELDPNGTRGILEIIKSCEGCVGSSYSSLESEAGGSLEGQER